MTQGSRSKDRNLQIRCDHSCKSDTVMQCSVADSMTTQPSEKTAPMPLGKAIGWLVPLYLLIALPTIWRIREICLLQRDECGYHGLLETVLSERLILIASVLILGLLVVLTSHVLARARAGTLGVELDPPGRRLNVSGLMVALVVSVLYTSGSLVILTSAASELEPFSVEKADSFFWKSMWAIQGTMFVFLALWHLNDYFVRPASKTALILLFFVTLGSVYWIGRSTF